MNLRALKLSTVCFFSLFLTSCELLETKEGIGQILGGAVGNSLGHKLGENSKYRDQIRILGTLAGVYVGGRIGQKLDEEDKARVARSTEVALVNGRDSSWKNSKNGTSGQSKVVSTETKAKPIKIPVLKSKVKKVPPLDIIGSTYVAGGASNVRGGPGTEYVIVGKINSEEVVKVVGKVKQKNWFLISQNGVGSGFVFSNLLKPAPVTPVTPSNVEVNNSDVEDTEIASKRLCRTIKNTVKLADGSTETETLKACQGPNGWEVQPIAS